MKSTTSKPFRSSDYPFSLAVWRLSPPPFTAQCARLEWGDAEEPPVTATAGRPSRRGRPGHDRDDVIRAGVQLFNEQGYDATSVSDLTGRLGVTKSALYHHVESKAQILEIALDDALGGLEDALRSALQHPTAGQRLTAIVDGAVRVLTERQPQVTLLLRLRGNSDIELAALERRRRFDHTVTGLVREAQSEGLVRRTRASRPGCRCRHAPDLRDDQLGGRVVPARRPG